MGPGLGVIILALMGGAALVRVWAQRRVRAGDRRAVPMLLFSTLLKNLADAGWVGHAQPGDLEANTLAAYDAVVAQQRIWLANHSPSEVLGEWPADLAGLNSRGEWVPALDARRRAFVADLQAWYDRANVDQPSGTYACDLGASVAIRKPGRSAKSPIFRVKRVYPCSMAWAAIHRSL